MFSFVNALNLLSPVVQNSRLDGGAANVANAVDKLLYNNHLPRLTDSWTLDHPKLYYIEYQLSTA